jgi:hypothetical protein
MPQSLCEWRTISEKPSRGIRNYVERAGQLGYPKLECVYIEKLGSDLAQLVCAPAARVEVGKVLGLTGPAAISHVHSLRSQPLRTDDEPETVYSSAISKALKAASGLLPFLAWIGAYDHEKDSNFVVDDLGNDLRRVVAIDFEDAFPWTKDEALEEIVTPPKPPGLSANHDRRIVNKTLSKIEMLTLAKIEACCFSSGMSRDLAQNIARVLHVRQHLVRDRIKELGWVD